MRTVAWFSSGVSSAVGIKLINSQIDEIIYIHINDQHPDTLRFVEECEGWYERPITRLQSRYKTVNEAIRGAGGRGYINGPRGAACSRLLKKRVRKEWELTQGKEKLRYVWGMDSNESGRAERLIESMPEHEHLFPLIQAKIDKSSAHGILAESGKRRPIMYDLGYYNNNCVGCVKGGMGYWNKIRRDFPIVFKQRAEIERLVGASCLKNKYLDELLPTDGRKQKPICPDCGLFCMNTYIV